MANTSASSPAPQSAFVAPSSAAPTSLSSATSPNLPATSHSPRRPPESNPTAVSAGTPQPRQSPNARHSNHTHGRRRDAPLRVETLVHAKQTGYNTAFDLQHFLKFEPREKKFDRTPKQQQQRVVKKSTSGAGSKRSRIERVECYIEPDGTEVVINPGFY